MRKHGKEPYLRTYKGGGHPPNMKTYDISYSTSDIGGEVPQIAANFDKIRQITLLEDLSGGRAPTQYENIRYFVLNPRKKLRPQCPPPQNWPTVGPLQKVALTVPPPPKMPHSGATPQKF